MQDLLRRKKIPLFNPKTNAEKELIYGYWTETVIRKMTGHVAHQESVIEFKMELLIHSIHSPMPYT